MCQSDSVDFLYSSVKTSSNNHAHFFPPLPHLFILLTSGLDSGFSRGECREIGGFVTSNNAFVGQEPMQDKQPTQFSSITTTGLLLCFLPSGLKFKGSKASNGQ